MNACKGVMVGLSLFLGRAKPLKRGSEYMNKSQKPCEEN
jgi:hypothetical protein